MPPWEALPEKERREKLRFFRELKVIDADISGTLTVGTGTGDRLTVNGDAQVTGNLDVDGDLDLGSNLTLATGGVIRTAALGQRIELQESQNDRMVLFSGDVAAIADPFIQVDPTNNLTLAGGRNTGGTQAASISFAKAAAGLTKGRATITGGEVKLGGKVSINNAEITLGSGVTTFAVTDSLHTMTGDAGANTIATITGGTQGMLLFLLFIDALITITDDNSHATDSVDLSAAFTSADDTILQLLFTGSSWYEVSRSVN